MAGACLTACAAAHASTIEYGDISRSELTAAISMNADYVDFTGLITGASFEVKFSAVGADLEARDSSATPIGLSPTDLQPMIEQEIYDRLVGALRRVFRLA